MKKGVSEGNSIWSRLLRKECVCVCVTVDFVIIIVFLVVFLEVKWKVGKGRQRTQSRIYKRVPQKEQVGKFSSSSQ